MGKIYLKKVEIKKFSNKYEEWCDGCYFVKYNKCHAPETISCGEKIFKQITERTAKKLLKSGWRVAK